MPYRNRKGRVHHRSKHNMLRWLMPYGMWTTGNGREVLFDRDYSPICERTPDGEVRYCDGREWVDDIVEQKWFYDDATPEKQKLERAHAALVRWGVAAEVAVKIEAMMIPLRRDRLTGRYPD